DSVVVLVAVECGVGDHHGGVAVPPERIVVAPCHPGNEPERRNSLQREVGVSAKRGSKPPHCRPGAKVRYDSDEVAAAGVEEPEQRRIALTAWFAAVAPDGLKRCHQSLAWARACSFVFKLGAGPGSTMSYT